MIRMMTKKKAEAIEAHITLLYRRRLTIGRSHEKSGVDLVGGWRGVPSANRGVRSERDLRWLARLANDVAALTRRSA